MRLERTGPTKGILVKMTEIKLMRTATEESGLRLSTQRVSNSENQVWVISVSDLLKVMYQNTQNTIRLSDNSVFELGIGKRVLKSEIKVDGKYPVYSANVFEPFGYIDKEQLEDFSTDSIVWGIDGDWMVNVIPANTPFYPTDHCGILRVKKPIIKEKYLAYALLQEGKSNEFSRTKRASIDRIKGIKIPLPTLTEQEKIVAEIEIIESKISELEKQIAEIPTKKESVLKKYL